MSEKLVVYAVEVGGDRDSMQTEKVFYSRKRAERYVEEQETKELEAEKKLSISVYGRPISMTLSDYWINEFVVDE